MSFHFDGMTFRTDGTGRIFISQGGAGREKTDFGNETVRSVNVTGSVRLNGTRVEGKVSVGGSVTANNATVGDKINVGGSATLTNTTCSQKVNTGGSITATSSTAERLNAGGSIAAVDSKISSMVNAGGSITANRCEQLGSVVAGGSVNISQCPSIDSISARHITLEGSTVAGNVSAQSRATVNNSTIGGRLTCSADRLVIEGSTIDTIELRCVHNASFAQMGGGFSSISIGGRGSSVVSIGGGSVIFGQEVVINGIPLGELMRRANISTRAEENSAAEEEGPTQTLELRNTTVKDVIFEGGNGEIILSGESALTGSVTGGVIKD